MCATPLTLTQGMLFRESLINGETFAVPLSRAQALDAVDSLARQVRFPAPLRV
jgi:hypothetical protein